MVQRCTEDVDNAEHPCTPAAFGKTLSHLTPETFPEVGRTVTHPGILSPLNVPPDLLRIG